MNRMLLKKYVGEATWLWLSCALALFAFAWVRVWVTSLFEFGEVQEILERFRRFEKFSPIPFDQLATYEGRVGMTYDEPLVLLCILVWGIARGSDVISGEIGRGTMEVLLSQPISRWKIIWTHGLVAVVGLGGLVAAHGIGVVCGVYTTTVWEQPQPVTLDLPFLRWSIALPLDSSSPVAVPLRERVDPKFFLAPSFNLFCLGFFVLSMAVFASSWERWRWRTVGLVVAVHAFSTVLFGLSRAHESLAVLRNFTYYSLYCPQYLTQIAAKQGVSGPWQVFVDGNVGPFAYSLAFLTGGAALYGLAVLVFQRRSIPPPL